ncbi:phage/plasmid primase, P4 family [Aliifodinibius sp. S!AR15-10]|uniref:DNA primase family protein n=1 Tax=Aliifodinibius sp. S!AR15-10 TaxID=2950437 RepID=UPI002866E2C6|nr:phage/plasmid primase, P4 family [Aliifodinibius sp. S!AR15-10]MDR8389900.1 phage/plasmid primase, P4 family [Aliifodinibius sp. S!AR15-10]
MDFITPEKLKNGVLKHANPPSSNPHEEVLKKLLQMVEEVNFYREAGVDKLNNKHFIVITIEKIFELAVDNNWGLCKKHDFIYLYNGAYWSQLAEEQLENFLGQAARKMGVNKFDAHYYQFREKLLKQFMSIAYLPTPEKPDELVLINLKNGTVEINPARKEPVKVRQPKQTDFLTYQLPFRYDKDASAPMFSQYLDDVLPDEEIQRLLAEYIGYVFVSSSALKLEKALILYGTGANGKSVFFEIVNALLGSENVSTYTLQSLTDKSGYYRAKLANRLLNYASEINGNMETALFKQLVSGEPVEARLPYGDPFTLTEYAKLIFNCNELPSDVEHTNAFFRRFMIVPFDKTIPESEQDKELAAKIIRNELSGVFNWVLEGLQRLLRQRGFTSCEAVEKQNEIYRLESDSVLKFLNESEYEKSIELYVRLSKIFSEYKGFCGEDGYYPVGKSKFKKRLINSGIKVTRKAVGNVVYLQKPQP